MQLGRVIDGPTNDSGNRLGRCSPKIDYSVPPRKKCHSVKCTAFKSDKSTPHKLTPHTIQLHIYMYLSAIRLLFNDRGPEKNDMKNKVLI